MNNVALGISFAVLLISLLLSHFIMMNKHNLETMAKNGLLFVSNAARTHNACLKASKYVRDMLYVKVKGGTPGILPVMSKQIVELYSKASSQCGALDVRLILKPTDATNIKTSNPIDVILYEKEMLEDVESLKHLVVNSNVDCPLHSIDVLDSTQTANTAEGEQVKIYGHVAVGGTFDRLHNGHKILLSQAALRASKHLTVGVTDVNMIQSKKLWELIEPVEKRIKAVHNFLMDINPDLEYNVVPIQDLYGPTTEDPRFELIVVSEETVRGGSLINEKRKEKGLTPLDIYVINLAEDPHPQRAQDEEMKVSSSNQRMRLLGTVLKTPVPNPHIPDWPYVIGLAGGIASGKSSIAEKLKAKGAAIVNCDIIAHELYKPGMPLNATISETFGQHVITPTGEVDRKKLGAIVFSDKMQLERLNSLIWPAIQEEAQRRVMTFGKEGYKVVVMEAAVMVRARWYSRCHQLWSVIIPPAEAVKRLQERNALSEVEAKQRIESQPSNLEQIEHANVVFSPYWSYEYTQSQIDRAWRHLEHILSNRKQKSSI